MTPSTPRGTRVSHIGIAVEALADTLPFFRDVLGLSQVALDDADGANIVGLKAGEPLVELLQADDPASPIARYVARKGAGIHHICFSVDDLDATLERCRRSGVQLIDEQSRLVSLVKADLRTFEVIPTSSMPSYQTTLTADERADLIAYLLSLKGR